MKPRVGVLALQGDFQAHAALLSRCGSDACEVRRPRELEGLHGLILPGGESTTMWHFIEALDLAPALQAFAHRGGALYGTCAGVILLARRILNPDRDGLGILDVCVQRNAYGRQTESHILTLPLEETGKPVEVVLIRAPRIVSVGPDIRTLLRSGNEPLWVEQGRVMGTTFHPELGGDLRFHQRFLHHAEQAMRTLVAS